jgi:hypothetical protein
MLRVKPFLRGNVTAVQRNVIKSYHQTPGVDFRMRMKASRSPNEELQLPSQRIRTKCIGKLLEVLASILLVKQNENSFDSAVYL